MIHQYQLGGLNIVIDVNSGAVHVVDEVAYDIIALYETASTEEIVAAMLEKKHGLFDSEPHDIHVISGKTDIASVVPQIISNEKA
jgi:uncharacterized protein